MNKLTWSKFLKRIFACFGFDFSRFAFLSRGKIIRVLMLDFTIPVVNLNLHPCGGGGGFRKYSCELIPSSKKSQYKSCATNDLIEIPNLIDEFYLYDDVEIFIPVGGVVIKKEHKFPHYYVGLFQHYFMGGYSTWEHKDYRDIFCRGVVRIENIREMTRTKAINKGRSIVPIGVAINYSHWILSHLPKILLAQDFIKKNELGSFCFLVHDSAPKYQIESLQIFNVPYAVTKNTRMDCERVLLYKTGMNEFVQDSDVNLLVERSRALSTFETGKSLEPLARKIFLSRKQAIRKSKHEMALLEQLEAYGFVEIVADDLSFSDQIKVFNGATHLVGWHGAGLVNMIWMSPGSKVMEISFPYHTNNVFLTLAQIKDISFESVAEESLIDSGFTKRLILDFCS